MITEPIDTCTSCIHVVDVARPVAVQSGLTHQSMHFNQWHFPLVHTTGVNAMYPVSFLDDYWLASGIVQIQNNKIIDNFAPCFFVRASDSPYNLVSGCTYKTEELSQQNPHHNAETKHHEYQEQ